MSSRLIAAGLFALAGVLLFVETGSLLFSVPLVAIGVFTVVWGMIKKGVVLGVIVGVLYVAWEFGVIDALMNLVG